MLTEEGEAGYENDEHGHARTLLDDVLRRLDGVRRVRRGWLAYGDALLAIEVSEGRVVYEIVRECEVVEEGKPYREFLAPAATLNRVGRVRIVEEGKSRRNLWTADAMNTDDCEEET